MRGDNEKRLNHRIPHSSVNCNSTSNGGALVEHEHFAPDFGHTFFF